MNSQTLNNDNTVLTLLDVCGSCITDIMYNFLFDRAIAIHEKTSIGLSEAYRQVLTDYVNESNTPKFYSNILNTLHHYVRMSTIFNMISYPDCISLYAGFFVPQMYVGSMTSEQKLNILTMVLGNTVRDFVVKIKNDYIGFIIDDHNDPTNIEILQDCILKIITNQRNQNYDKFIQSQKTNNVQCEPSESIVKSKNKTINHKSLIKLSTAFKKSIARKNALETKNHALVKKNKQLSQQFTELKDILLKQIAIQKDQYRTIESLKKQLLNGTDLESDSSEKNESLDDDHHDTDTAEPSFDIEYL